MIFLPAPLDGAYIIETERLEDDRGFFARTFCQREFDAHELEFVVRQCSLSFSRELGTLRGMHFQFPPFQEAKLVRCTAGAVYDVIVDLRPASTTFCRWFGSQLTAENRRMMYVPHGFAHGLLTLAADTEVFYQISEFYHPESAAGVRWDDSAFSIDWPAAVRVISDRDRSFPDFVP